MKKLRNYGRRILAMALVFFMLLSYLPKDIVAVDTDNQTGVEASSVNNFTVRLVREEVEETEEPAETTAPADESEEPVETVEETVTKYKYTVTAKVGEEDVTANVDDIFWFAAKVENLDTVNPAQGSVEAWKKQAVIEDVSEAVVTVVVAYRGMYLRVSNETAENTDVTAAWGMENTLPETIYVGIPVDMNPANVVLNKHSSGFPAGGIKSVVNEAFVSVVENKLIAKAASDEAVEIFRQTAGDPDAYAQLIATAKIAWPSLSGKFTIGETVYASGAETEWFTEAQTVAIQVTCPEGFDSAYLPRVIIGDAVQQNEWTAHESDPAVWTTSVEVAADALIVVGGETLKVNIDAKAPEITNARAYINGEVAIVKFSIAGISGVKEVTVNGTAVTSEGDDYTVEVSDYTGGITIEATGNNGLTATKNVVPQAKLAIEFACDKIGFDTNGNYVANNSVVEIKVYGATESGTYKLNTESAVVKNNGETVTPEWKYVNGTWIAVVEVPVTNLSVTVSDGEGRSASATLSGTYMLDKIAPVISVTKNQNPSTTVDGVNYYQSDVTFTVTVSDASALEESSLSLFYVLDGENAKTAEFVKINDNQYTAQVTVRNGEKLVSMGVTAKDISGNAATGVNAGEGISFEGLNYNGAPVEVDTENPTLEFSVSKNVTQFFVVDGVAYAVIDAPVTDTAEGTTTVTVTAKAADKNLIVECEGWTDNGDGTWTYTKEVANHTTDVVEFTFTVKDKAGRMPAESVTLAAAQSGRAMATSLSVKRGNTGIYSCKFNVDRRFPSSGADSIPPQIVLTAPTETAKYNGNELFHDTVSFDLTVTDVSANGADSGVASVFWSVSDASGVTLAEAPATVAEDGKYTISGTVKEGYEAKDLVLSVKVADNVGNTYTYSKTFHVDNKAPEVTVTYNDAKAQNESYFSATRTATISVKDVFFDADKVSIATEVKPSQWEQDGDTWSCVCTYENDGEYTLAVNAADQFHADANVTYIGDASQAFIIDKTPSVITVTEITAEGDNLADKDNAYHTDKVSFKINVTDKNLTPGTVEVTYQFKGEEEKKESVTYTGSEAEYILEVAPGQTLVSFKVDVKDAAGNPVNYTYEGKPVAVDKELPQILVGKTGSYIQTIEGRDYYDGEVVYTITITDDFLVDGLYTANAAVTYEDVSENPMELAFTRDENGNLTASFTVIDAKPVKSFSVKFVDVFGKTVTEENVVIADGDELTGFTSEGGVYTYSGNVIVVDMTAPKVTAQFSVAAGNKDVTVEKFFAKDGKFYAYLNPAVEREGPINRWFGNSYESVQATITFTLEETNPWAAELEKAGWTLTDGVWTFTRTVEAKRGEVTELSFEIAPVDMAGNKGKDAVNITTQATEAAQEDGGYVYSMSLEANDGVYAGKIFVDRKTADMSSVPTVDLSADECYTNTNGLELYNQSFNYTLTVTDSDAGIADVQFELNDGLEGQFLAIGDYQKNNDPSERTYVIPIEILEDAKNETDSARLTITVTDNVGNKYTFLKYFAVDNLGSRVTVVKEVEEGKAFNQTLNGTDYYNGEVTYTVHVKDQNLAQDKLKIQYTVDGTTSEADLATIYDERNEVYFGTFTVTHDQVLTDITVIAPDVPGNDSDSIVADDLFELRAGTKDIWAYTGNNVVVDKEAPVVTVTKTGDSYFQTGDNVNYYSGDVTYIVEVTDDFMTVGTEGAQKLILTYTYEDGSTETVSIADDQWTVASKAGADQVKYTYDINVENGQVLTEVTVQAVDNAGNAITEVKVEDKTDAEGYKALTFTETAGTWVAAPMTAVDTEPAVVTISKIGVEATQVFGDYAYYSGKLTYSVMIEDEFLNKYDLSEAAIVVTYMDGSEEINALDGPSVNAGSKVADLDTYVYKYSLKDGDAIKSINVLVRDNAGNYTKEVTYNDVTNGGEVSYTFNEATKYNEYEGKGTIMDTTAPTAKLTIGGNVSRFYTNNGVVYVALDTPAEGLSGAFSFVKDAETVTLTLVVNDKNISLDSDIKYPITGDDDKWNPDEIKINADSSITYTDSIEVKPDACGVIAIDLSVFDLAGNPISAVEVAPIKDTVPGEDAIQIANGKVTGTFSVDRRRPSSIDDENKAPEIILEASVDPCEAKSSNGREMYAGAFSFHVNVTDGEKNAFNSGLADVYWTLTDEQPELGVIEQIIDQHNPLVPGTYNEEFDVDVNFAGESNTVYLTVTAVDNVGNTTTYVKEFAVDNLAPRIAVRYDNNNVRNERYFNADRTATISVTDINFKPEDTIITTEVTPTAWVQDGDTWICTSSYTVDGEYNFAITSTDLAGNNTPDENVDYEVEYAPRNFVIDKTAPVITVAYDPVASNGTDDKGVHYYDEELDVTVTIRELNFRSADVVANFGARNQLTGWNEGGEIHVARETFEEGNEYSFSISYSDLAGNPAVPYHSNVFSVDLDAPTITISRGDLTNDELNIVQDDLVLGFQIKDEESNLKDYTIKVTRLNNEFKEEVVSGADFYTIFNDGDRTTVNIDFAAIEAIKENDGIYTISITARDYAEQSVSLVPEMVISLNRFGSTFMTDDPATMEFLSTGADGQVYNQSVDGNLIFKEINPNKVWQDEAKKNEGSTITLSVNGNSIVLKENEDYTLTVEENGEGKNKWYVYIYEIDPSVFYEAGEVVDGKYTILFYGVDEAGNVNSNETNAYGNIQMNANGEYTGKVAFTLDHMAPVIAVTGIEERETYNAAFQRMQITISDSSPAGIDVYLDDVLVERFDTLVGLTEDNVWVAYDAESGKYVVNITEQTHRQSVKVLATDAAGNSSEYNVNEFLITTNAIVRLINNPIFIGGVGLAAVLAVLIPILKKKKAQ